MRRLVFLVMVLALVLTTVCFAQQKFLLIDDFEGVISAGPSGTVDSGTGNGSALQVTASTDIKQSGNQSIKVDFDAVEGGYMWVARGKELVAKSAGWLIKPEDILWDKYNAISFYIYGTGSNAEVAFDIKDNGNEIWRFLVKDDFKGWKQVACAFNEFFVRGDWQPDNADKNWQLDFPIKSFQFEPRPSAKGTLYFDAVVLVEK
ncbi:MAG: carbohydrate binding domain-containing protein [Candidatus Omnitrophota bacterium]